MTGLRRSSDGWLRPTAPVTGGSRSGVRAGSLRTADAIDFERLGATSGRFFCAPPLSQPRHDGMADLRHANRHNREIVIKS